MDITQYGIEGSAALWSTEQGFHQLTFESFTTEPDVNQDQFLFWDGQQLFKLSDRSLATTPSGDGFTSGDITIEVNAVSDEWGIVALDMGDAAGDSEIRIKAIEWYGDGEAAPLPEPDLDSYNFDPTPSDLGVVGTGVNGNASGFIYQDEYIGIDDSMDIFTFNSTDATFEFTLWAGNRSLAVTLSDDAGMVAQFLQAGGQQTYTWNLYGNDANYITGDHTLIIEDLTGDGGSGYYDFAIWQGGDPSNASQTEPNSAPVLDPLTGYPTDPHTPIYNEPPYPIPDTGRDLGNTRENAWDMGILKPWETDSNTGITWNNGYVYGTYHLGHSYISEKIGGGDVTDWTTFTLDEGSYLNFYHSNAVAEILDSSQQVVVGSNDAPSGNLQAYLEPGLYYLHFSSEASIRELFHSSIYLSNSDPHYAD